MTYTKPGLSNQHQNKTPISVAIVLIDSDRRVSLIRGLIVRCFRKVLAIHNQSNTRGKSKSNRFEETNRFILFGCIVELVEKRQFMLICDQLDILPLPRSFVKLPGSFLL